MFELSGSPKSVLLLSGELHPDTRAQIFNQLVVASRTDPEHIHHNLSVTEARTLLLGQRCTHPTLLIFDDPSVEFLTALTQNEDLIWFQDNDGPCSNYEDPHGLTAFHACYLFTASTIELAKTIKPLLMRGRSCLILSETWTSYDTRCTDHICWNLYRGNGSCQQWIACPREWAPRSHHLYPSEIRAWVQFFLLCHCTQSSLHCLPNWIMLQIIGLAIGGIEVELCKK